MDVITFGKKENPCVVFLHGWGGGFSSFSFVAKNLSDKFYCVVVDFNSIIFSDRILTIDDFCDEVLDYLRKNNISKASFVAHSFGGRIVARLAERNSPIFDKIVLADTAGLNYRRGPWFYLKIRWFKFLVKLAKRGIIDEKRLKKYGSPDYAVLTDTQKQTFKNVVNLNLKNGYKKIDAQTLIYWGENDTETPLYMAKSLKKIIKNSALIVEKGADHFAYLKNINKFNRILTIFLES